MNIVELKLDQSRRSEREELAQQLEALAADLRRINSRGFSLSSSSYVEIADWNLSVRQVACLKGLVVDHPILGTQPATTSELYYFDKKAGVARTLSRWYRLGSPHEPVAPDFES